MSLGYDDDENDDEGKEQKRKPSTESSIAMEGTCRTASDKSHTWKSKLLQKCFFPSFFSKCVLIEVDRMGPTTSGTSSLPDVTISRQLRLSPHIADVLRLLQCLSNEYFSFLFTTWYSLTSASFDPLHRIAF